MTVLILSGLPSIMFPSLSFFTDIISQIILTVAINSLFIFSNFYEDTNRFPKEFIKSYSKWISENEIKPSKYRFLNSNNELLDIENIR